MPDAQPPDASRPRPPLDGLRVLVVDDNATNRQILEEMIASWRMLPSTAGIGADALALMDEAWGSGRPFRLVLVDGQMPQMDGFEFIRRVRKDPRFERVKVILLTSMGGGAEFARSGAADVSLTKPVKQSALLDAITRLFGSRSERRAQAIGLPLTPVASTFNEARALAYTGGDRRLLAEVVELFLSNHPAQMRQLGEAVQSGNGSRVHRAAHALKGGLATLGAERALAISKRLEGMGSSNQLGGVQDVYRELEEELARLCRELRRATARQNRARARKRSRGPNL